MKFLQDYQEEKQSKLLRETGSFFAFGMDQFKEEKKIEHSPYINCGGGLLCPKVNYERLVIGLDKIHKDAIRQDLKENGRENIIKRELWNHESFYTMDYTDTVDALKDYPITIAEINAVFQKERHNAVNNQLI